MPHNITNTFSAYLSATPLEVVLEVMEDPEGLPTLWTMNLLQGLEDLPPGPGGLLSLRTLRCVLHTQPGSHCRSQHTQNQAFNADHSAHSAVYCTHNQAFSPNHEAHTHIQRYKCTSIHTQILYLYTHTHTSITRFEHTQAHTYIPQETHTHTRARTLPNFQYKHKSNCISSISPLQFGAYVYISSFYNSQLQFAINP